MKFTIFQESRLGGRRLNQDRVGYRYSRDALLMVVADGMGGHANGELASGIAVQYLTEIFDREARSRLSDPARFLHHGIHEAHDAIHQCVRERNLPESPRTTCVACVVQDGVATWAHVGDSRLYHVRGGEVLAQTRDHSKVQWLVDTGKLGADAASRHPDRNKVFNCLGGPRPPQVDLSHRNRLEDGDALLLCTDGLWGALTPAMITGVLSRRNVRRGMPTLLDLAQQRAGSRADNLSVVAMGWTEPGETTAELPTQPMEADAASAAERAGGVAGEPGAAQPSAEEFLSDEEIERAIEEIRSAIRRRSPLPGR
jgi:serine/threonine protein phosphatase PrpC